MDSVWEKLHSTREWGKYPADDLIAFTKRSFRGTEPKDIRVVDIGCGAGANLAFFVSEGFDTAGIDGSESAILNAKARMADLKAKNLDLRVGNFNQLPWGDSSFDLAVDYMAIYANPMDDIRKSVSEIYRVLKDGGQFYSRSWAVGTTGWDSGKMIEKGTSENPSSGPCAGFGISHFFSEEELRELFSQFSNTKLSRLTTEELDTGNRIIEWIACVEK